MADSSTALVSWNAVTTNSDATPITDLAGYRVFYSQIPSSFITYALVGPAVLSKLLDLNQFNNDGTWYFAVAAVDTTGNQGTTTASTPASKRIIRTRSKLTRRH